MVLSLEVANSKHGNARCFEVVRTDGTTEDFSYHKCVLGATEIIAPKRVNFYKAKYLRNGTVQPGAVWKTNSKNKLSFVWYNIEQCRKVVVCVCVCYVDR